MYNIDEGTPFSYSILPIQNIHLRSGKFLEKESPVIIEEKVKKERNPNKIHRKIETSRDKAVGKNTSLDQHIKIVASRKKIQGT